MIAEALAEYAKATARVFLGRENSIGASEVGQCARKIFFAKNVGDSVYGAACDEDYADPWGAALRGRLFEDHCWVPALRARYRRQAALCRRSATDIRLRFPVGDAGWLMIDQPRDALAALGIADIGGDGSIVVECKTIDPRVKLDAPKPEHAFQVQVQIGLFRELTPHRPEVALISYANASFLDDVIEFVVRFEPAIFANAKRRAAAILTAQEAQQLKPEGWIAGGRECEFCAFNRACGVIRHAVPTKPVTGLPDPQFVAEIADLAREAKQRRAEAEAATRRQRAAEEDIRERLRAKRLRRIAGDDFTVVWSPVKGRPSYDMQAIREAAAKAGIDLGEYETVGESTDRLVIRVAGQTRPAA